MKKRNKRKPILTKKVRFSYNDREILKGIDFEIKPNQITAIIGKSGSGKTTFLKIIASIIPGGYKGKIQIFGKKKLFQKNKIGFVPQQNSFIPDLSIEENIKIMGLNLGVTEKDALKRAEILLDKLKLEEDLKKKPTELSGGQQNRLNIILSMLHNPKILILDEPFTGLDFRNRRLLWHFLEKLKKQNKSIVLTSHLLTETQEHIDKLILLRQGKVFFSGIVEKLKQKLKVQYIYETKFSVLSKEKASEIKKYCIYNEISIIDSYDKNFLFALRDYNGKEMLNKLFKKLNLNFNEVSFREANLDEIFMKE